MQFPLYEYYNHSDLTLNEVRKHYLEHFYYEDHSRNDARKVLKIIVGSSRIGAIIEESMKKKETPSYRDYMAAISKMPRFMLRKADTKVLAVIDAALRWDIEVNDELELMTSEELKKDSVTAFKDYKIYKEMAEEEIKLVVPTAGEEQKKAGEECKDKEKDTPKKKPFKMPTWTLPAFIREFGELEVGEFVNGETGEKFKSCIFRKDGTNTFVAFSSKLGVLTPEQINSMRTELVVVRRPSGSYSLAKPKKKRWKKVVLDED